MYKYGGILNSVLQFTVPKELHSEHTMDEVILVYSYDKTFPHFPDSNNRGNLSRNRQGVPCVKYRVVKLFSYFSTFRYKLNCISYMKRKMKAKKAHWSKLIFIFFLCNLQRLYEDNSDSIEIDDGTVSKPSICHYARRSTLSYTVTSSDAGLAFRCEVTSTQTAYSQEFQFTYGMFLKCGNSDICCLNKFQEIT